MVKQPKGRLIQIHYLHVRLSVKAPSSKRRATLARLKDAAPKAADRSFGLRDDDVARAPIVPMDPASWTARQTIQGHRNGREGADKGAKLEDSESAESELLQQKVQGGLARMELEGSEGRRECGHVSASTGREAGFGCRDNWHQRVFLIIGRFKTI